MMPRMPPPSSLAQHVLDATPPWSAFVVLLVVLAASSLVYAVLVLRTTTRRRWLDLTDWADRAGFAPRRGTVDAPIPPPTPLAGIRPPPRVITALSDARTELLQVELAAAPGAAPDRRHLLVRRVEVAWPPTGLRPAAADRAIVDLFTLPSHPSLAAPGRFAVVSGDVLAARLLARSSLPALLPGDLGLLLYDHHLIIDFTARPFDPIELPRLLALADQLVSRLPAMKEPTRSP